MSYKGKISMRRKGSLRERFQYWFDNRMTKGSVGLIRILIAFSVLLVLILAGITLLSGILSDEEDTNFVLWNSLANLINAEIPTLRENSVWYTVLMAIIAIIGLLFASVLIGIITSAIENKISELRKGNSIVLENGHIVILGFTPGEYTLIQQLILAADGKKMCVVIAEDMERDEMEDYIYNNIPDIPENFRIVCRSIDICDPMSIAKCSISTCRTVIVNPMDDMRTIKVVLAVSTLLQGKEMLGIRVTAIVSSDKYKMPASLAQQYRITTIQTNDTLARMIAHSCTQKGLSDTFSEIFNFEGCEFYVRKLAGTEGLTFEEIMYRIDDGVPVGIVKDNDVRINPDAKYIVQKEDQIIVFSENIDSAMLTSNAKPAQIQTSASNTTFEKEDENKLRTIVIGYNDTFLVILRELPEDIKRVTLVNNYDYDKDEIKRIAKERDMEIEYYYDDISKESNLVRLVRTAEHIIILNDHKKNEDEADMDVIFYLLNLRDIRLRLKLDYNITAEMRSEKNQKLVFADDHIDFLVSSRMTSLILVQLAESPDLIEVFRELLSNKGNELHLKSALALNCVGEYTGAELRSFALGYGYVMIGYMNKGGESFFNPALNEVVSLNEDSSLIVIANR